MSRSQLPGTVLYLPRTVSVWDRSRHISRFNVFQRLFYADVSSGSGALDLALTGASLLSDESDLEALTGASLATGGKGLLRAHLYQASASTLRQCCDDACDSVLIEDSGVA